MWVPPSSRANIEQEYFDNHFGDFFRINAMWFSPLEEKDKDIDVFTKPYLELAYFLQVRLPALIY